MKSFKSFLAERRRMSSGVRSILNRQMKPYEFWLHPKFMSPFPITKPMMKKLESVNEGVSAFHITDIDALKNLFDLEGSAKQISTVTQIVSAEDGMEMIEKGIETAGGVVVELTGDVIFPVNFDVFSEIDSQGRRWIDIGELTHIMQDSGVGGWYREYSLYVADLSDRFYKKHKREIEEVYDAFYGDQEDGGVLLADMYKDALPQMKSFTWASRLFWAGSFGKTIKLGLNFRIGEEVNREKGIIDKIESTGVNTSLIPKIKRGLFQLTKGLFDKADEWFVNYIDDFPQLWEYELWGAKYDEYVMDNFKIEDVYFKDFDVDKGLGYIPREEMIEKLSDYMSEEEIISGILSDQELKQYFSKWVK